MTGENAVTTGTSENLRSRIERAIARGQKKVLLSDDLSIWTGENIRRRMKMLAQIIEKTTVPNSRVAVSFPNWAVQGFAILTVIACGRIPVILNHTDLTNDTDAWLTRADVSLLLTINGVEIPPGQRIPYAILSRDGQILSSSTETTIVTFLKRELTLDPVGTALVLFTSGSTGSPKGVLVPEEGLLKTTEFLGKYFGLNSESVAPIILPVCHSMALNTQFFPTFLESGRCYFVNPRLSMSRIFRTILSEKGTFVSLIGEVLKICWEEKNRKGLPAAYNVRHIQLAGGLITKTHLQMAKDLFPNAVIHKGYGLTEAIRVTMINSNDPNFESAAVGRPLDFLKVELRNERGLVEKPEELAEVFVKGPSVMLGTTDGKRQEDGFLATGDLGYWNKDSQLCIAGRKDSLIKINGHRISGFEIEKLALESSELIKGAKCLVFDDERRSGKKLVLLLEVQVDLQKTFMNNSFLEMQTRLWQKFRFLSHFPKEVMVVERFARTTNGKVSIKKLEEAYLNSKRFQLVERSNTNLQFYGLSS